MNCLGTYLFTFFLALTVCQTASATHAVRCQDQWLSLDYALTSTPPPYGDFFLPKDLEAPPLIKALLWAAIVAKTMPTLREEQLSFMQNESNETDFSKPMVWQSNDLPFPSLEIAIKDLPGLAPQCQSQKPTVTVYEVIRRTQRGKLVVFEYDRNLAKELSAQSLQFSFLKMSAFLQPYTRDLPSRASMNAFLHTPSVMSKSPAEVDAVTSQFLILPESAGICNRSAIVTTELQHQLGLPCEDMRPVDLEQVTEFSVVGTGRDTLPFTADDFVGLTNVTALSILKTNRFVREFERFQLRDLKKVKVLRLNHHDIDETPKTFMEGPYQLTELDLSTNGIFELKQAAFRHVFVPQAAPGQDVVLNLAHNGSLRSPRRNGYVHAGAFDNCQAVTKLSLQDMNILTLATEVFDPLVNLTTLDLSQNSLRSLAGSLASPALKKLRLLDISENNFTIIAAEDLAGLQSLETLIFAKNNLDTFPEFLLKIPSLKELTFCGRKFKTEDYKKMGSLAQTANPKLKLSLCQ